MPKAIRQGRLSLFALLLWLGLLLIPVQATVMRYLEIEELARLSTEVFHGQVLSTKVYWDDSRTRLFTAVRVQVSESFKGRTQPGQVVTVTQLGGALDGVRLDYAGRPRFEVGEALVLFTKPGRNQELLVVGLKQGKLRVVGNEAVRDFSGITLVEQAASKPGPAVALSQAPRVQPRLALSELRQRIAKTR